MLEPQLVRASDQPFHRGPDGALWCDDVPIADLVAEHGSPLYVYSARAMAARFERVASAFGDDALIAYAVKANSNLAVLRRFARLGSGFDVVSGGELHRLVTAGVSTSRCVFAGVGKQADEIDAALAAGIAFFNVESAHELELLEQAGAARGMRVPVAVRINPDVEAGAGHAYIATGKRENKFGLPFALAAPAVQRIAASPHLELVGYHVHLGSQLRSPEPYLEAFDKVAAFADAAPERSEGWRYYDLGGGFGVAGGVPDAAFDVGALGEAIGPRLAARGLTPVVEPGRYLVADAGALITRVLGTKDGATRRFVLVDAAMNDLLRPALYSAQHPIVSAGSPRAGARPTAADVVGPVCESGDFLGKDVELPPVERGDLLAVLEAGAYGASMASNYNTRTRPAEVLVEGAGSRLIRRRETVDDLLRQELDT